MANTSSNSNVSGDYYPQTQPNPPLGLPLGFPNIGNFTVSGITTWTGGWNIPPGGIPVPNNGWLTVTPPPPLNMKLDISLGIFINREKFFSFFQKHCEKTLILFNRLEKRRSVVNREVALQVILSIFSTRTSNVETTTFINDSDFHLYLKKAKSDEEREQRLQYSPKELNKALD